MDHYKNEYGEIHYDNLGYFAIDLAQIIYQNNKALKLDRFTRFRDIMVSKIEEFRGILSQDTFSFSEDYEYDWNEDEIYEILTTCREMVISPRDSWHFWTTPFWIRHKTTFGLITLT
tara:strand:- start:680 stop:1030 length:351 start_codon:yes stop_codon:yes gene_type:complete